MFTLPLQSKTKMGRSPRRWHRRVAAGKELALAAAAIGLYEGVKFRSGERRTAAFAHARQVLGFERALGIDVEMPLQRAVLRRSALRRAANGFYAWSYWPMLVGALAQLWRHDRDRY